MKKKTFSAVFLKIIIRKNRQNVFSIIFMKKTLQRFLKLIIKKITEAFFYNYLWKNKHFGIR
jgi:hypothetical protein